MKTIPKLSLGYIRFRYETKVWSWLLTVTSAVVHDYMVTWFEFVPLWCPCCSAGHFEKDVEDRVKTTKLEFVKASQYLNNSASQILISWNNHSWD